MAVFLRKEADWNQAAGESDDAAAAAAGEGGGETPVVENKEGVIEGSAEDAVQQTFPEVITSLDEIHAVGTLAQVRRWCWRGALLSETSVEGPVGSAEMTRAHEVHKSVRWRVVW